MLHETSSLGWKLDAGQEIGGFGRIEIGVDRREDRPLASLMSLARSPSKKLTPVALPPGRERETASPSLTGSSEDAHSGWNPAASFFRAACRDRAYSFVLG